MRVFKLSSTYTPWRSEGKKETDYSYAVAYELPSGLWLTWSYTSSKTEAPEIGTTPCRYGYLDQGEIAEIVERDLRRYSGHGTQTTYSFDEIYVDPTRLNLAVPEGYFGDETVAVKTEMDRRVDGYGAVRAFKDADMPIVVLGEDRSRAVRTNGDLMSVSGMRYDETTRLWCSRCGTHYFAKTGGEGGVRRPRVGCDCPSCGNRMRGDDNAIVSKGYADYLKKYRMSLMGTVRQSVSDQAIIAVADGVGFDLYRVVRRVSHAKGVFKDSVFAENGVVHKVGEEVASYRYLKSGDARKVDAFDALNFNSKSLETPPRVIYDGHGDFIQFAKSNSEAMRRCGFIDVASLANGVQNLESFFLTFVAVTNTYPVIEQIVKAGHASLFFGVYDAVVAAGSKQRIAREVEALSQIVDSSSTKAGKALRFPSYIGDYLNAKRAKLAEYYAWRDMYELTHMSKEQFEAVVKGIDYALIAPTVELGRLCNILKFGYRLPKLLSYIAEGNVDDRVQLLNDYLQMCDLMEVEPDKYPANLRKAHDDMTDHMHASEIDAKDTTLARIAGQASAYALRGVGRDDVIGVPKAFERYDVVFPKSVRDFVEEGNRQHNCVGSYPGLVVNGVSVVFFIRKKEEPHGSFVTAECDLAGLKQIRYSNNRKVDDDDVLELARFVSKRIAIGCRSGEIDALR